MKITKKNLYAYLIYAGVIPYFISSFLFIMNLDSLSLLGGLEEALSIYSLVIISFLCGSHWGQSLKLKNDWSVYLPISSAGISVFMGFYYLLLPFRNFLCFFFIVLAFLLWTDKKLQEENIISKDYFKVRLIATSVTFILILVIAFFSYYHDMNEALSYD